MAKAPSATRSYSDAKREAKEPSRRKDVDRCEARNAVETVIMGSSAWRYGEVIPRL
jgi:hypothetical protein